MALSTRAIEEERRRIGGADEERGGDEELETVPEEANGRWAGAELCPWEPVTEAVRGGL